MANWYLKFRAYDNTWGAGYYSFGGFQAYNGETPIALTRANNLSSHTYTDALDRLDALFDVTNNVTPYLSSVANEALVIVVADESVLTNITKIGVIPYTNDGSAKKVDISASNDGVNYTLLGTATFANYGNTTQVYVENIDLATLFTPATKYLIQSGTTYYKWVTNAWVDTTLVAPLTQANYETHGMDTLTDIIANIATVSGYPNVSLLEYYDESAASRILTKTLIPEDQVLEAEGDIDLTNVTNIDSFTLTATATGTGVVRIAVSYDSGVTWVGEGGAVDITDTADFLTNGYTIAQLNAENFNTLNLNDTIRFAYLLGLTEVTDVASLNTLSSQLDYPAELVKQFGDTNIELRVTNNNVHAKYKTAGDYVLNIIQ